MLEQETFLMEGQEGKDMDKLVSEYVSICQQIEDLTKVKTKLADTVKAVCNTAGTYETYKWYFKITERKGSETVLADGKAFIKENYPQWIKYGEPCIVLNTPKQKGDRV